MSQRWIVVAALGLWLGGCAGGVDDPLPPPPTAPEQAPGEASTLSGGLSEDEGTTVDFDAPPLQLPAGKLPTPEPGQPAPSGR